MAGRPKIENSRDRQYRVRLNDSENKMLEYASCATGRQKAEIFRQALIGYYQNVKVNEFSTNDEDWIPDRISLKRVVECPYCEKANGIDFSDYCSESVDEDRPMGDEITYSFDIDDYECVACHKIFRIDGFICEYPVGAFNYEEINTHKGEGEENEVLL